jgi:hypothetical protein
MKKIISISFVLTAYCLLLLHSVIPHHHHQDQFAQHHNGLGLYDDYNNDIDNNFLSNAFSLLQHDNGGSIIYTTISSTLEWSKIQLDKETLFFHADYFADILSKAPFVQSGHIVFHLSSSVTDILQLRGPPVPMA